MENTKICSNLTGNCPHEGKELPLTSEYFYRNGRYFRPECKKCYANFDKERNSTLQRKTDKRINEISRIEKLKSDPIKYKEYLDNNRNVFRNKPINEQIWKNTKSSSKRRNIEFTITPGDIIVPEFCPIFPWIKLNLSNDGWDKDDSSSCDRIDNNLGYIKGNIIITSLRANKLKRDSNNAERKALFEFYEKYGG